ncbi:MAG: O-antigen ligase family protein [Candidatus Margulisbacteria bacterium]|nr:O-antigen ligase family protein [Candidatus Margulisiibacteriota bacterium]
MNLDAKLNKAYLFFSYAVIFGTTLFFSTATRSVFEVNKLGILKIGVSFMGIIYLYDRLLGSKTLFYPIKKHPWFNASLGLVWLSNALSTIFSKNIVLSFFGCYDRWEGLLTVTFYLLLTFLFANKTGLHISNKLIWAIIIASGLSSLYGIIQSYDLDIISWSLDPSQRVFGSINNPVHYCAIMGMAIPIILGQIFSLIEGPSIKKINARPFVYIIAFTLFIGVVSQSVSPSSNSLAWIFLYIGLLGAPYTFFFGQYKQTKAPEALLYILFNSLGLVIYACYLSYSRATWLGVTASIGLLFTITLITRGQHSKKQFLTISLGCLLLTMAMYLTFLFNLYTISTLVALGLIGVLVLGYLMIYYPFKSSSLSINAGIVGVILLAQFFQSNAASANAFGIQILIPFVLLLIGIGIAIVAKQRQASTLPAAIVTTLVLSMNVQFIGISLANFIHFSCLVALYIALEPSTSIRNMFGKNRIFYWKLITFGLIGLIFVLPSVYNRITTDPDQMGRSLIGQASEKIKSFNNVAIEGTARTSMWKSAFPWISDHPFLGTGLDTIKYYFPKYRRSEYGRLEGGHNYTPDRLHNEYLNTLATKGIFGFIIHYILFIGGTMISLLLFLKKAQATSHQFIVIGLIGGALVYLGQVLFNFGVVATMTYFFIFLGLGASIKHHHD